MKVNNLLKKVGSVITTAALLATLGTTAFADGGVTVGVGGDGISITKVETVQHENSTDVYDVTVTYKTTKKNVTGMTMLAYRANTNKNTPGDMELNSDAQKNAYDDSKYGEGENSPKKMQIVGIEQNAAVDGISGDGTGSFTFTVTTNSTNNGAYYIAKGKKALVAVSGDQCKPAYALFGVNATAKEITPKTLENPVSVAANASDAEIQSALDAAVTNVTVEVVDDVKNNHQVSLDKADIKDGKWTPGENGEYTKSYTFQKGNTYVEGVEFKENKTVTVTATITKTAVDANTVSSVDGLTAKEGSVNTFEKTYSADQNTEESVIKDALFKDKTAKIANGIATGTVTLESGWAKSTGTAYDKSADEDQNLVYEVTIPNTATVTGNEYLKIAADGLKFTVNVTVSRTQYISAITLDGAPGSIDVSSTATDDQIKEALNKAIKNATIKIDETEADKSKLTMEWVIARTENVPTSAKLHVSAVDSSLGNLPASGIDVTPAINITVKTGVAYILGDVDGDRDEYDTPEESVTDADWMAILNHLTGYIPYSDLDNKETRAFKAANVDDSDEEITDADWMAILNHLTGYIPDGRIGKEYTK